jgi:hypothetical protein
MRCSVRSAHISAGLRKAADRRRVVRRSAPATTTRSTSTAMESPVPPRLLYIGGAFVAPAKGGHMDVVNPGADSLQQQKEQLATRLCPRGSAASSLPSEHMTTCT